MEIIGKLFAFVVLLFGILAMALGFALIVAWPLQAAINWLFASSFLLTVFGVAKLSFWQTAVLMFVTTVLFKSSPSGGDKK